MRRFGPGMLVAAAFIGPGTVTTASVAGSKFGFALLWALLFSVLATVVLQQMAARLGLVTGAGLAESIRVVLKSRFATVLGAVIVLSAIGIGNAAFEMGNIMGASMGMAVLTPVPREIWALVVGIGAAVLLYFGTYKVFETAMVILVGVMSSVFVVTMVVVRPDLGAMASGLFRPSAPEGAWLTIIALIGTTVVPYNLFLHASSVSEKWPRSSVSLDRALAQSRVDTAVSIGIGGLITLAITTTAAAAFFVNGTAFEGAAGMATQLEPLLGSGAKIFFATGLMAAGLSSAITAPLAAAYATAGVLGFKRDFGDRRFRAVWMVIIAVGTGLAFFGQKPVKAILFAQAANGIALPAIAVFLIVVMNRSDVMGNHKNGLLANLLGSAVVLVAAGLGLFQLLRLCGWVV